MKVVVKIMISTTPSRLSLPPLPGSVLKVYMVLSNFGADQEEDDPVVDDESLNFKFPLTNYYATLIGIIITERASACF